MSSCRVLCWAAARMGGGVGWRQGCRLLQLEQHRAGSSSSVGTSVDGGDGMVEVGDLVFEGVDLVLELCGLLAEGVGYLGLKLFDVALCEVEVFELCVGVEGAGLGAVFAAVEKPTGVAYRGEGGKVDWEQGCMGNGGGWVGVGGSGFLSRAGLA